VQYAAILYICESEKVQNHW